MLIAHVGGIELRAYETTAGVRRIALASGDRIVFDRPAPSQAMSLEDLLGVHAYVVRSRQWERRNLRRRLAHQARTPRMRTRL